MFSCSVCGRTSKAKETIDKCKHTRLKTKTEKNGPLPEVIVNEIVLNENATIDTIFHCSDIHIRLNKRHNEYKEVFNNFYRMLEEKKKTKPNSLIVCCGDILHQKLDLSPEAIIMVLDFLENLALIFPTIIIAGNHDALLTNNHRQDSLSGILHKRTINNLWYLKDSGIYRYGNLVFGVSSLLDNTEGFSFISANQITNGTKIGLYHGAVGCPINSEGFKLSGERKIQDFDGYDLVLLGDIHMFQYLNEEKTIAYSSSLISQNFGETDQYHGFLEWDIPTKTSKYNIVENPYRFISIDYNEDILLMDFPPKCNLRIKVPKENGLILTIDNLEKELRKRYPEMNLVIHWISKEINIENSEISDYGKIDILSKLEEYIENMNDGISEEEKAWLLERIEIEENKKPVVQWELLEMRWDNLCKYTTGNKFNFRKLDKIGLNGIIASNSAGKSSLLDILCFLLFGTMTRNISNRKHIQPDIINIHHTKGNGEIFFRIFPNKIYKIEKQCVRTKDNSIKVTSSINRLEETIEGEYEWDNKKWKRTNLSGKDRLENDKIVEELIGSYDDFVNGSLSLQFDNRSFRSMAPKARKEYLLRIFNLEQFISQYDQIRKKYSEIDTLTNSLREKQMGIDEVGLRESLEEIIGKKLLITAEIEKKISCLKENRENYDNLLIKITNDNVEDYDVLIGELNKLTMELEQSKNLLDEVQILKEIETNEVLLKDLEEQIEILKSNKEAIVKIENQISEKEYREIGKEIEEYEEIGMIDYRIGELRGMIVERPKKESRRRELIEVDLKVNREKLNSKQKKIEEINGDIGKIEEETKDYSEIEKAYRENEKRKEDKKAIEDQIKSWDNAIEDLEHNHEFNPECYICMRNNNTQKLIGYRKTRDGLKSRLNEIVLDGGIEGAYKEGLKKKVVMDGLKREKEILYGKIEKYRYNIGELERELVECEEYEKYQRVKESRKELERLEGLRKRVEMWREYGRNIEVIRENERIEKRNRLIEEEIGGIRDEIKRIREKLSINRKLLEEIQGKKNREEIVRMKIKMIEGKMERAIIKKKSREYERQAKEIKRLIEKEEIGIKNLEKELIEIEKRKVEVGLRIGEYERDKEELGRRIEERTRFGMLKEIVGPKGFSLWLLEDYLREMSRGITNILWEMIKLRFEIKIVENDIMIYSYRGDGENMEGIRLDMYGGMESFLIDLSFKIVMMEMSRIPKCLFLLIDEGIAAFDSNNLGNLDNLWGLLGNIYQNVILITHIDKCKDYLTNIINIETNIEGKYSRINI